MPTAQELKRACEALDAQITAAEQEEHEAKEARLRAEEEARVAAEKARLGEEARERELTLEKAREAAEAQARAEEEARKQEEEQCACEEEERCAREEEGCPAVERDLREEGGPSRERAPWQRLFLPLSSDSAISPEEEEGMEVRVEGPSWDKGKGWAPVSEEAQGEVTGVVCDLCDKKGIPCWWGKVSDLSIVFGFY